MNPWRTSLPDLREAGETSDEEEKWNRTERRGRGVSLKQTVTEIFTLGGDKTACVIISPLFQTTLNSKKGLPRNYEGSH